MGLSLSREAVWSPDPHEIALIGDSEQFRPRAGAYTIQITSELREVDYLDHFQLLAVDHPRHIEIHPTDKFMLPPFSPSRLWAVARPMSLTLDFGPIAADCPLVLALTGWLNYGDASSNITLSQDHAAKVVFPVLEAETTGGDWVALDVNVGMPAGKTKTVLCDLSDKLPPGIKRLRLTTTFEIRWDRVALLERQNLDESQIHELAFTRADLQWRGFSELRSREPGHPPAPDHDQVFAQPPWHTTLEGWCTRYGDVRPLIARPDGKLVVLNGGDALTLSCPADGLPALPSGMARTFFLRSVGWDKEDNANTVDGDRVEPLPGDAQASGAGQGSETEDETEDWRIRYNTRWVPRDRFDPNRRPTRESVAR